MTTSCNPASEEPSATTDAAKHIDADWFRHQLIDENVEHWLVTVQPNGFFAPALDRQWQLAFIQSQHATPVSQARLIFNFAAAYEQRQTERFLSAVRAGADFMLASFIDPEHGGVVWMVGPQGELIDGEKNPYGHAFAILGFACAYRVTEDDRYRVAAMDVWKTMQQKLRDEHGGLMTTVEPDFTLVRKTRSQNPVMHKFEALLALYEVSQDPAILADAKDLLAWVKQHIYQPDGGYFAESFDANWQPLPAEQGGHVNVGHQFEWAYLLSEAVRLGFDEANLELGMALLDYGLTHGYDAKTGSLHNEVTYSGQADAEHQWRGWWQQCELLRAVMRYAARHGRADLWPTFDKSLAFAREKFIDREFGGWYEAVCLDEPESSKRHKGSIWKAGYHETNMYLEGLRIVDAD